LPTHLKRFSIRKQVLERIREPATELHLCQQAVVASLLADVGEDDLPFSRWREAIAAEITGKERLAHDPGLHVKRPAFEHEHHVVAGAAPAAHRARQI
jgi:hypothetical protein